VSGFVFGGVTPQAMQAKLMRGLKRGSERCEDTIAELRPVVWGLWGRGMSKQCETRGGSRLESYRVLISLSFPIYLPLGQCSGVRGLPL
jgi:hypothetical protein